MSKRPLTRRVGLCYVAAAGLQRCGAAGTTDTTAIDDDLDVVSLGAMQPPLTSQAQPSSFGLARRPRPAEPSFGKEESPDQTLSRLLQHTFGALGSALDDSKLEPNTLPVVDGIGGAALTPERSVDEAPSRVPGEDVGKQPASLYAAEVEKLAGVVAAEPKEEKEEEEEGGQEGKEEEERSGQDTINMSLGTGVASELGSQQEGAVSTESHSRQGSEVGDAVNGSIHIDVAAVTAEHVDTGIAGEGADAIEAAVALEDVSEAGAMLDAVPAPVRSVDSPPEPGIGDGVGGGGGEEEGGGEGGATACGGGEALGGGGLGQYLDGATMDVEVLGDGGLGQHLEGGMAASEEVEASSEGGLGQHLGGGAMTSEVVEAFGEGGLGQDGDGGATTPGEVMDAVSKGGMGEHRGGAVPATGDLIGQESETSACGPIVPDDALVVEDGGVTRTADGADPIKFIPDEDAGATREVIYPGDAAGTDALTGGGGEADNAGAGKDSADIDDTSFGSAGEAGLEVLELRVAVEETEVPDGAVAGGLSQEMTAAPPEIDVQASALEVEEAAPMSGDVQESDASERNVVETPALPDDTIIRVVEGSEAGDRSEPHGLVTDVLLDVPLAGADVNAIAETTGDFQEHSTTAVGTAGGTDGGEALTGDAEDDDTSRIRNSDAPAGSIAEREEAGGHGAVEDDRGAEALEAPESAKGGGLPEAGVVAVDIEPDGARGGGVGEVAESPLAGFGESVGSVSEPSETDASPENRLRPGDAPTGETIVISDATWDAAEMSETPPTSSGGGNDKTVGMGSERGGEDQSPRERRVFRFSEPPGSRAVGESAGLPGMRGDASSDGAKKIAMPPIKPIDVSPDDLQKFRVPEDSPEAGIERIDVWSAWGKRWAGVAMEAAVQVAKVVGGQGRTAASSGLQFCKARMIKAWHEIVEPRTEHVRLRLETAAMAGLDEVGEHLADPMLAEAI